MKAKVQVFDQDASSNDGYVYTTETRLSSRLATQKLEDLILEAVEMESKRVVDIGCGDGHFTRRFFDRGRPASIAGLDPAPSAIGVAESKIGERVGMSFIVGDGHALPWPDDNFDLAIIQGVLHHDDEPQRTISEAFRVAREVVILEPNGNNIGLKVIEKASRYHREHFERSYSPVRLLRWIKRGGGSVTRVKFGGFVPMFCPDWFARTSKRLEPLVEKTPLGNTLACAVIVVSAQRYSKPGRARPRPAGIIRESLALKARSCPLCGSEADSKVFAPEKLDPAKLGRLAFSSRKLPEYMHYRLMACPVCDVVYADPAPSNDLLGSAYEQAGYDSSEEAAFAARTYGQLLHGIIEHLPSKRRGLDIGAGDGAFLETLLDAGFSEVIGVEPSTAPILAAADRVRPFIRQGMFSAKDFTPGCFDLITCFQTLEHVTDPAALSQEVNSLLAPEGAAMFVCHDRRALSARALGRKSPIFDIEHLQLFSPHSVRYLLEHTGYVRVEVTPIFNRYPLRYWTKLFPLPAAVKKPLLGALGSTRLGSVPVSLPAGNLVAVGYKG